MASDPSFNSQINQVIPPSLPESERVAPTNVGKGNGHSFIQRLFGGKTKAKVEEAGKKLEASSVDPGQSSPVSDHKVNPKPKMTCIGKIKALFALLISRVTSAKPKSASIAQEQEPQASSAVVAKTKAAKKDELKLSEKDMAIIKKFTDGTQSMSELMKTPEGNAVVAIYAKKTFNTNTVNFFNAFIGFQNKYDKKLQDTSCSDEVLIDSDEMLIDYNALVHHYIDDNDSDDQVNIGSSSRNAALEASKSKKPKTLMATLSTINEVVMVEERKNFKQWCLKQLSS